MAHLLVAEPARGPYFSDPGPYRCLNAMSHLLVAEPARGPDLPDPGPPHVLSQEVQLLLALYADQVHAALPVIHSPGLSKIFYTDKKENEIFLLYKEIQMGSVAKSYMRKGFLLYEEMRKYLTIYEEAFSYI
jgi:hypothetical protein